MSVGVDDAPTVHGPGVSTPPRAAGSVRRTSTIDMRWPGGIGTDMTLSGRARDLLTPADRRAPRVLAETALGVRANVDRSIRLIEAVPPRAALDQLVGGAGGRRLRSRINDALPDEREKGSPLYLLLDDLAGATLIGGFAYSQWPELWPREVGDGSHRAAMRRMEGICAGFRPGASSLDDNGGARFIHDTRVVSPLADPADPIGWHRLEDISEVSMRRARRIDVRVTDHIEIDSMFQDSATTPQGGRVAVHEYHVHATADWRTGCLTRVSADPRVLPYVECPLAASNVDRLVGVPLADLRSEVLERLKGIDGCTHLNDALRALAEVPVLAGHLVGN